MQLINKLVYHTTTSILLVSYETNNTDYYKKGSDLSVYVLMYMLYSCQDILPLAQKPVVLQRRLGLLEQCLRDVALRHHWAQISPRQRGLARNTQLRRELAPASLPYREHYQESFLPHDACSLPNPTANTQAYTPLSQIYFQAENLRTCNPALF